MKLKLTGILLGVMLIFGATGAQAAILEVFGEYPFSYRLDEGSADSVSGFVLGVRSFALPAGLGYESYTVQFSGGAGSMDVQMYNLFYASAFPLIELVLGIGLGTGSLDSGLAATYSDPTMVQYYLNLGYTVVPLFGVFLGMHLIDGSASSNVAGTPDLNVSGRMTTLGIRFGF